MDLTREVATLALARAELEECKDSTATWLRELEATQEWKMLQAAKSHQSARQELIGDLEATIRDLAILDYNTLGDKRPHDAVAIKVFEVVKCDDPEAAKSYAIAHDLPHLLKLDDAAIKKAAKASPIPGMTITEEPRATIASDLTGWLPVEECGDLVDDSEYTPRPERLIRPQDIKGGR